ncbi:hypothetical protein [Mycobacterium kubicae]|uniref:hypothetical protein n=1 Tax=Mycobacterium kubicae TaxID=120959 RepID=UPI0007FE5BD5|nr:hypothetical protein [Mycobacterium kubicae]OBF17319.1 hypothetical protein A5725_23330 [Mycobacterium kubicae]OBK47407.1 hypothetical protein A5657_24375 [Mycobacterium kubicae]
MRIGALVAIPLLLAGCSHDAGSQSEHSQTTGATPPSSTTSASAGKLPSPPTAPAAGAPMSEVIAWVEAAHPADPAKFHTAAREGVTNQLGDDSAFSASAGAVACTTDTKHTGDAVACLVKLTNPPPRPDTAYGEWKGGWVNFDGTNLQVGAARADPGPFVNGDGPELANGSSLFFGDYRCRADQSEVICVNYAHQSAARLSAAGVEPYGCLRSVPPPDGVGVAFAC